MNGSAYFMLLNTFLINETFGMKFAYIILPVGAEALLVLAKAFFHLMAF